MVRSLYRELLRLRRETPALRNLDLYRVRTHADEDRRLLLLERSTDDSRALIAFNFGDTAQSCELPFAATSWRALIDTGAKIENGTITLPPSSFALFGAAPDQG